MPPTKECRCDRQRNWSRHSTRLVPLHVFRARPDIKTLSANTSPLALTEQHNIFHKHVQTPRHSQTGQHNTLHKHVQTPRHTSPDATGNADIRAPMLHLSICALYLNICASISLRTFASVSLHFHVCASVPLRFHVYASILLTANPNFSPQACEFSSHSAEPLRR